MHDLDPATESLEALAGLRRLLTADNSRSQAIAIDEAFALALQPALVAWEDAEGRPPVERLVLPLGAAARDLEGIAAALAVPRAPAWAEAGATSEGCPP